LIALATKLPLAFLLCSVCGMIARRVDAPRGWWTWCAVGAAVPLVWLSLFEHRHIGLRHALMIMPLLAMFAAAPLALLWQRGVRGRLALGRGLAALCVLAVVAETAIAWPHLIGAFNPIVGDRPYLWFSDTNTAWEVWEPDAPTWGAPDSNYSAALRVHP